MANYNRVILVGNLTRDPELSYTPSNTPVCKFGLAVNRSWNDKQTNTKREETMFIDCTAWSRSAEVINQYCRKGRQLLVEGRLQLDQWTSPEGQKRSKHTVVVDSFQFVGARDDGGSGAGTGAGAGGGSHASAPAYQTAPPGGAAAPPPPSPSEDVPF
jgi:single-strand DNA-binding protein